MYANSTNPPSAPQPFQNQLYSPSLYNTSIPRQPQLQPQFQPQLHVMSQPQPQLQSLPQVMQQQQQPQQPQQPQVIHTSSSQLQPGLQQQSQQFTNEPMHTHTQYPINNSSQQAQQPQQGQQGQQQPIPSQIQAQAQAQAQPQPQTQTQTQAQTLAQAQAQAQIQLNNKAIIEYINNAMKIMNETQLKEVRQNADTAIQYKDESCIMSHLLNEIDSKDYAEVKRLQDIHIEHKTRNDKDKLDKIFPDICNVCSYLKMGLHYDRVEKQLPNYACRLLNKPGDANQKYFYGSFLHTTNPFKTDTEIHANVPEKHVANKNAFSRGIILIPLPKLFLQILAMRQESMVNGIVVVQIMSDETNVTDMDAYMRFFYRNRNLNPGYYKRAMTGDELKKKNEKELKDWNDKYNDDSKININVSKWIKMTEKEKCKVKIDKSKEDTDEHETKVVKGEDFASWDNANHFQNGMPMSFVKNNETCDVTELGMKVFHTNTTTNTYLQHIINIHSNIKSRIENNNNNSNKDKTWKNYLSTSNDIPRLLSSFYYDILTLAFYTQVNHDNLLDLPPLNDKCVMAPQNILVINRNGDAIMVDENNKESACNMFNRLLNTMPMNVKSVTTASPSNLSYKGNPPNSRFHSQTASAMVTGMKKIIDDECTDDNNPDDRIKKIKAKYKSMINDHTMQSQEYHSKIKQKADSLRNYFCLFKDDMNEDVPYEGNEVIYDIASKMYPSVITQNTANKHMYSLDYTVSSDTKPVVDMTSIPNVILAQNVGFVSLTHICDEGLLTLKNTEVLFENILGRDKPYHINKQIEDCRVRKSDDDTEYDYEDEGRSYHSIQVRNLPKKTKLSSDVYDIYGSRNSNDFNPYAYLTLSNCGTGINDYMSKYGSENNKKSGCLSHV